MALPASLRWPIARILPCPRTISSPCWPWGKPPRSQRQTGVRALRQAVRPMLRQFFRALSSKLSGPVQQLFGITRFRVDPGLAEVGSTGSEQNAAARVTVEQQIARNLTITYVSNVSSTQQQVIQVEYNVDRNVSIVGLRDQNGTFGIDIKIKKRF